MQHISGADIDIVLGTTMINVKQFTLNIEDGVKPTTTRGVPHGFVRGTTTASGEITVDTQNFNLIMEAAESAGSFQELDPFDITTVGKTAQQEFKTAAYGCKLRIAKLLDAAAEGGDKLEHTLPFDVTDSRFVEINGKPYLDRNHVEKLGL